MYCATFTITSGWRWFDSNSPDQTAGEFEGDGQYNEITSGDTGIDMVGNGETVSTGLGGSYAYDQSVSVSSSASCGGCASDPMSASGTLPSGLNWTGSGFSGTITQAGPFSGTVSATELGSDGSPGTTGSADWNFTVSQATQSVSFQSTPPSGATYTGSNNQTYGVAASSTSGLPVALTIDGSSTSGCTISGTTVYYGGGAGTCIIDANQAGNGNYTAASQSQQSFTVNQASQSVSITSPSPSGATYTGSNNQTYGVAASSTSGLPVALTIDGSSTSGCTISGTTVYYGGGAGTCIIDANQAGNGNYTAAGQSQQSFQIGPDTTNTITITSTAPSNAVVGGATYTPTATATSGDTVVITSATTSVCTISSGVVSFLAANTCTLNFNDAGNSNYVAATQQTQSLGVGKGTNTITVTSPAPTNATVGGATYTPTATATSGDTVVITSVTTTVCTISSGVVSFLAAGTCTLNFNDSGNTNWNAATQVQQSFTVNKKANAITITSTAPASAVVGGATYTPTATATSGDTVVITSATTSVCTISSGVVSFLTANTCTLNFNDAGNSNYGAATQQTQSFSVGLPTLTITASSEAMTVGSAPPTITPSYSGFVNGDTAASLTTPPTCLTTATSSSSVGTYPSSCSGAVDAKYTITYVLGSVTVSQGGGPPPTTIPPTASTITITSTAPASAVVGGATYTPTATATSGDTVVITSATTSICTISSGVVSFLAAGTCTLNFNDKGNSNYVAATQKTQTFSVGSKSTSTTNTITFTSSAPKGKIYSGSNNQTYTVKALATSGLTVTLTIDNKSTSDCTISGTKVSYGGRAGTCVIDANQSGNAKYSAATQTQQTFWVGRIIPTVTISDIPSPASRGKSFTPSYNVTAGDTGTTSVTSKPLSVCIARGLKIDYVGLGMCSLTAHVAATTDYAAANGSTQTFSVGQATPSKTLRETDYALRSKLTGTAKLAKLVPQVGFVKTNPVKYITVQKKKVMNSISQKFTIEFRKGKVQTRGAITIKVQREITESLVIKDGRFYTVRKIVYVGTARLQDAKQKLNRTLRLLSLKVVGKNVVGTATLDKLFTYGFTISPPTK